MPDLARIVAEWDYREIGAGRGPASKRQSQAQPD
jgi:hypothetical protein